MWRGWLLCSDNFASPLYSQVYNGRVNFQGKKYEVYDPPVRCVNYLYFSLLLLLNIEEAVHRVTETQLLCLKRTKLLLQ